MSTIKTILIADDSHVVLKLLIHKLNKAGYKILTGADGKEALHYFDGRAVDLVITDLNMPVMDGLTFIRYDRLNTTNIFRLSYLSPMR
jgi:two-component system chemotaxis response regulator CheY